MEVFLLAHGLELRRVSAAPLALSQPALPTVIQVMNHWVRRDSNGGYIKYRVLYEGRHRSSVLSPAWLPYDAPHPGFAAAIRHYFKTTDHYVSTSSLKILVKSNPDYWNARKSLVKLMRFGRRLLD